MKSKCILASLLFFSLNNTAFAQFEGDFLLEPTGCEALRSCALKNALRYTDLNKVVWEAKAGLKTDGATIPSWAQPFIGQPYDKSFIKAAVIHDHYCDKHVRPWRQTHRAFYDALVDLGVPEVKSKLMYYAVYLGGPKWVELVPGNKCGFKCINNFAANKDNSVRDPIIKASPESFEQYSLIADLKELESQLAGANGGISLEALETRAKAKSKDSYYYKHGDTVKINNAAVFE